MVNEKVIDKRAEGGHGFLRLEDAVSDDFGSEAEHARNLVLSSARRRWEQRLAAAHATSTVKPDCPANSR